MPSSSTVGVGEPGHYNCAMHRAAMAWITGTVISALERGDAIDPKSLTFLLRRYGETGAPELRAALEPALAHALEHHAGEAAGDAHARWLTLFAEALTLSEDDRLHAAATDLIAALRGRWGQPGDVGHQASGVEACLVACHVVDPQTLVPAAIDELERIVGAAYRVGLGLGRFDAGDARGWIPDHVRTASALLTAYEITGRLPYSMLAEELVQFVRRTKWGEAAGRFEEPELDDRALFVVNCDAARVLSRLAHLHGRDDYRAGAVCGTCTPDRRIDRATRDDLRAVFAADLSCPALASAASTFRVIRAYAIRQTETDYRSLRVLDDMFG